MRVALLLPALCTMLLIAAGCNDSEDVVTQDIVTDIPWEDGERTEYIVYDDEGEDEVGTGVVEANLDGDRYTLSLDYEGTTSTDASDLVVDATTLKPVTLHRVVETDDNGRQELEGEYDPEELVVTITQRQDDEERTVPHRIKEHYYDNETSVFLWRTIPFEEGWTASYYSVVLNLARNATITLSVTGKEQVTVPAGTFDAWVVEIEAGGAEQKAWFADTPDRRMVQYDNTLNVFKLANGG
jgi:hypothetical protein